MYKDELAHILRETPEHNYCVTVPRKFLVKLYAEISQPVTNGAPPMADGRLAKLEPHLTRIEYKIMKKLLDEQRVVSPGALMAASGAASVPSLWVHKNRLIRKLAKLAPSWTINTIRNVGYQLVETEVK